MTIRLSKFIGRDQLPGDEVAFERINRLFDRARQVQPPPPAKPTDVGDERCISQAPSVNFKLSKFVGRDQLPGDEVAFDRINRLFARARKVKPAGTADAPCMSVGKKTPRGRKTK